jgi:hypothetical protein
LFRIVDTVVKFQRVTKDPKTEVKAEAKAAVTTAEAAAAVVVASTAEAEASDSVHRNSSVSNCSAGRVQVYQVEGGWVGSQRGNGQRGRGEEREIRAEAVRRRGRGRRTQTGLLPEYAACKTV